MRTLVPAVVLAALLLLAGCSGGIEAPEAGSTADSDTTEPAVDGAVVAYEELNSQQQDAFRAAIRDEARFVPESPHIDEGYTADAAPFREHEYVRYEGDRYRLRHRSRLGYASYQIDASAGSPNEDDTVVAFTDLPENVRDEVETAITEGSYHAPMGKWGSLPEPLADTEYVRYENETYGMGYAVGDAAVEIVRAERVE